MKLEYLEDISSNGKFKNVVSEKLIRLFEFDAIESALFQSVIDDFVIHSNRNNLVIDKLDFIQALNCRLTFLKHNENHGISQISENEFICQMNVDAYRHMIMLIEPFNKDESTGFQWLDEQAEVREIDLLFSCDGSW